MPNELKSAPAKKKAQSNLAVLLNRPCYRVYDKSFEMDGGQHTRGVYYHYSDRKTGEPRTLMVCGRLRVVLQTVEKTTGLYSMLIRFDTSAGPAEMYLERAMLSGKGGPLCETLLHRGLFINKEGGEEHVVKYVAKETDKAPLVHTVGKVGWQGESFVLPGRTFGPQTVQMKHGMESDRLFKKAGTLEGWQDSVARFCVGNPVLLLSVSTVFGAMLLKKTGVNGGGFHLKGDSSTGKTLAQFVACSALGEATLDGYLGSWDTTKNGLEAQAEARNDLPLILDEIKRVKPHLIQEIVYMLSNGQGKSRMTQERAGEALKTWRTLMLSSGEKSLTEHAALSGDPAHAGAELRMVDVDAGNRPFLAFDNTHGESGKEFWRRLDTGIKHQHGTAAPAFLDALTRDQDTDIHTEFQSLLTHFPTKTAQAGRVADRFAVTALGGELASQYGVTPWPKGAALDACKTLYTEWTKTQGQGNTEDRQILGSIADFLDAYGDARFTDITFGPGGNMQRAGYFQLFDDDRLYLFSSIGLREAARGFSLDRIVSALLQAGVLTRSDCGTKNQRQYRIRGGGRKWLYCINPEKLTNQPEKD